GLRSHYRQGSPLLPKTSFHSLPLRHQFSRPSRHQRPHRLFRPSRNRQAATRRNLVVSAAAGATGSIVGQIGKIHGCRVVGIAGSDDKCQWIKDELGFDAAINYKHPGWKQHLAAATPNGIDIDFENVGGEIMQAVLDRMNLHGRVILCGLISGYTREDPAMASFGQVLMKRLRVEGFIILDFASRFMDAAKQLGTWKMMGKLKDRQTIVKGLEKAPEAINMLFEGKNIGKLIVEL